MSRPERVVYEHIAKRSKIFAERLSVLCLFYSVTGILKKNHFAVLHSLCRRLRIRPYDFRVRGKLYFLPQKL